MSSHGRPRLPWTEVVPTADLPLEDGVFITEQSP